jgi:hypothetical protein
MKSQGIDWYRFIKTSVHEDTFDKSEVMLKYTEVKWYKKD